MGWEIHMGCSCQLSSPNGNSDKTKMMAWRNGWEAKSTDQVQIASLSRVQ